MLDYRGESDDPADYKDELDRLRDLCLERNPNASLRALKSSLYEQPVDQCFLWWKVVQCIQCFLNLLASEPRILRPSSTMFLLMV